MKLKSREAKLRLQTATAIAGALLATGVASPALAQSTPDSEELENGNQICLLYTSPSPRDS